MLAETDFAEAYGWPPEVTGRLPLDFAAWNPLIRQAKARVQQMRQAEADRAQRLRRLGGAGDP